MQNFENLKKEITGMAKIALEMWLITYQAFMEHDLDLGTLVLERENKLNVLEKELTAKLIEVGRKASCEEEKTRATIYANVVGDLELIGDYCKDILERVQIKIEEKLLFSEDAIKEYGELFNKAKDAFEEVVCALEQDNFSLVKEVAKNREHIDTLVDEYRQRHNQRMIDGICSPMACNMFLNMLDFTAAVYYHIKKIAKNLLKV